MLSQSPFRFGSLLVLVSLCFSFPVHAQDQPLSDYLELGMRPSSLLEPARGSLDVSLHLSVEGRPDPVCVAVTADDGTETTTCTPQPRPHLYGDFFVRVAAGDGTAVRAVVGASCSEPLVDVVPPSATTSFEVSSENDLVFDLVPLTLCADDLEESPEILEVVIRLSRSPNLDANPIYFDTLVVIEDATLRRELTVTGGDDVQGRALHFTEGDRGDRCRPVDLTVTLSVPENNHSLALRFELQSYARNAERNVDFRFDPPSNARIPLGDPSGRFRVGCIIGDDDPEPDEVFNVLVEIAGRPWTRVSVAITIVDDEPRPHVPGFLDVTFGGRQVAEFVEGDEPAPGLPMVVRYSDGDLRSFEMRFRIATLDGTARAGEDYEPIDREFVFGVGHLGLFDIREQMRLRILPDLIPEEPVETFYLAIYAILPGGGLYFSEVLPLQIQDDDLIGGLDADGGDLWVGAVPAACPSRQVVVDLPEPGPGDAPYVDYPVDVFARRSSADGEDSGCGSLSGRFAAPVRLLSGGLAADPPAVAGSDLSFAVRPQSALVFAAVDHHAQVVIRVYSDGVLEADEYATLSLSLGYHGHATLRLRIVDFEKRERLAGNRDASFARLGRVMATMLSEALSDRFSCARASGCRAGGPPAIGARDGLGRLASVVRSLAPPDLQRTGAPASARLGAGGREVLDRPLLERVGARVDGLSVQGSPSGWFGPREPRSRTKWSAWARSDYVYASDSSPDGSVQRTSMLGVLGGVDRRFNLITAGALYGLAWAQYGTRYSPELAALEGVEPAVEPFENAMSWQLVAPYIGVQPHDRVRTWMSYGRTVSGSFEPSPGYQPASDLLADAPRYSFTVAGASVTAARVRGFVLDVEGDWFVVGTALSTCPGPCGDSDLAPAQPDESAPGASPAAGGLERALSPGDGSGVVEHRPGRVGRRRLGLRLGVPLGGHGGRALSLAFSRRWDTGPDVVWLFGGHDRVHAYDLGFDLRLSPEGSRLSASLNGRVEVRRAGAVAERRLRHRERAVGGSIRWGRVETAEGWSVIVRPRYGYPGIAGSLQSGSMAALLPDFHAAVSPMPLVDLSAGYGFEDGARLVFRGSRGFGERVRGALGAGVNYERGW